MVRILRLNSGGIHRILDRQCHTKKTVVPPIIGSIIASIQTTKNDFHFNNRRKFSSSNKSYGHYNVRCYSQFNNNTDDASIEGEYLPLGVTRQSDFFGETITFVDNLDTNLLDLGSVHSSKMKMRSSNHQSTKAMEDADDKSSSSSSSTKQQQLTKDVYGSKKMNDAVSSFDGTSLCIISRGSANLHSGNDASGPDIQAYHASSLAWSELLRHAYEWNSNDVVGGREQEAQLVSSITTAPMLVVATVASVLAQGGSHYVRKIDNLLSLTTCDSSSISSPPALLTMAHNAVSYRDDILVPSPSAALDTANLPGVQQLSSELQQSSVLHHLLTPRERWHLHALYQLLNNNHREAMGAYLRLLELYPGDLLGLSLALDVAYTLGDSSAALRAAMNVSTYWTERDGGAMRLQKSHPVQNMAISLIAVGLSSSSVSSRTSTAERLAETALARDADGTGGTSVWALSHCLASEGRSAEMVSKLAGYDGTQFYEACGYLHFSSRMKGYGSIALLDRKGAGADRSAVRLYDGGFGSVLEYSGYNAQGLDRGGGDPSLSDLRAPSSIKKDVAGALGSMLTGWFSGDDKSSNVGDSKQKDDSDPSQQQKPRLLQGRRVEDVLCWLPPSPLLLAYATAVLLRLTLSGAISESDGRWADIKAAWTLTISEQNDESSTTPIEYMPLALVAASLVINPNELHMNEVSRPLKSAMIGLYEFGKLMKLGQLKVVPSSLPSLSGTSSRVEDWRLVMSHLARARDNDKRWEMPTGISSSTYIIPNNANVLSDNSPPSSHPIGWDFDLRQFLEYALIHASLEVGDYESLCLGRAICSEGITLRSNCPELWWRYGRVLDMLGDDVAAENAKAASISLGSGEGGNTF